MITSIARLARRVSFSNLIALSLVQFSTTLVLVDTGVKEGGSQHTHDIPEGIV